MADDDMPEMAPSKAALKEELSRTRAILKRAAESKTMWGVVDEYMLDALIELRLGLNAQDHVRRERCAERIAAIFCRMPPRPALPPEAGITPGSDEWKQRCKDAEQDAAVRAYFMSEGWTPPVPSKERN